MIKTNSIKKALEQCSQDNLDALFPHQHAPFAEDLYAAIRPVLVRRDWLLATACVLVGVALGWALRGWLYV